MTVLDKKLKTEKVKSTMRKLTLFIAAMLLTSFEASAQSCDGPGGQCNTFNKTVNKTVVTNPVNVPTPDPKPVAKAHSKANQNQGQSQSQNSGDINVDGDDNDYYMAVAPALAALAGTECSDSSTFSLGTPFFSGGGGWTDDSDTCWILKYAGAMAALKHPYAALAMLCQYPRAAYAFNVHWKESGNGRLEACPEGAEFPEDANKEDNRQSSFYRAYEPNR